MGLFGGGNSKKVTTNQDNRVINDFSNADLSQDIDNSVRHEVDNSVLQDIDNSITGEYAGNTGTITVTDGGAFDLASDVVNRGVDIVSRSLDFLDESHDRNLSAAVSLHQTGFNQLQLGTDLARDLVSTTTDSAFAAQQDNNAALTTGFKNALQFAEDFSRSDGAAVAETNMKTIAVIAIAGVIATFIFKRA